MVFHVSSVEDLCFFADDSTIVFRGKKGEDRSLSIKIDNQLLRVNDFLAANNLKLNISKTQLLRTASRQQHAGNKKAILHRTGSAGGASRVPVSGWP